MSLVAMEGEDDVQKTVCYFMTRNLYRHVIASLNSLLMNGNIDRVELFIEDDDIGFDLPSKVVTFNVESWRDRLDPTGPNYNNRWTYMVMLKPLLCRIMPRLHRALTLDVDTIVRGDLSPLWDIQFGDCVVAGVREPFWTERLHRDYVNAGVLFWNLDKMRAGMADRILYKMNNQKLTFVEQDAINDCCRGRIKIIDAAYNAGDWTEQPKSEIKIRHYMASKGAWKAEPEVLTYAQKTWEQVLRK